MANKKTETAAAKDAKAAEPTVSRKVSAQIDPLNEKVRSESEEAAMVQDEIRKGRRGVRGERLQELASMQPKAVTEPDLKGGK